MPSLPPASDRRKNRSADALVALGLQLAEARSEAGLDCVILADHDGLLLAGVGDSAACDELAALAPLGSHARALRDAGVEVVPVQVEGTAALLCARGGGPRRQAALQRAASGCARILATRAA